MKGVAPVLVRVGLDARAYPIAIGSGLLCEPSSYPDVANSTCAVVTDDTVAPLFAERLENALAAVGRRVVRIVLPSGETFKEWQTLQSIFDALVLQRCDRGTILFALGGGVIGDLTGFAAACYMRGVRFVQVPTTLLAQVDSSVGGKTGINHPGGKNLIGAFHQPIAVVTDIATLDTLPRREFISGLAEVIKYGAIADPAFFGWLEENLPRLLERDPSALIHAIRRSCEIKAAIVEQDEHETGPRAFLNFGHTFAHAIETGAGYGQWLHGEAVGCGMAMAADLSVRLGLLPADLAARIQTLIGQAGLPLLAPRLGFDRYFELALADKKAADGKARFVLVGGLGRPLVANVPEADLARTLKQFGG